MIIRNKTYLIIPALLLCGALLINTYIVINVTPSMKKGIYFKLGGDIKKGGTVLFCLDQKNQRIGLMHHYLEQGKTCKGADPLIKEVVALPDDKVVLADNGIAINNHFFFYKTSYRDTHHQLLSVYPRGQYYPANGFWVIGTYAKNSWDSRYWGPIQRQQIIAKLIPLMTWD